MFKYWRKLERKYRFKDSELFSFYSKTCSGYLMILDMRRPMEFFENNSQIVYENEKEFLEDRRENYIKVVITSSRELEKEEYLELIDFIDILLDYSPSRDWNVIKEIINIDDFEYLNSDGTMFDYAVREYEYFKKIAKKYGVEIPEIEINDEIVGYLSQD